MEDLKQRKRNLLMFPLGTIGRDMVYCLVTNFLLTYIMFTKGLTAAQLAAVTAIMVVARVFDALNDPRNLEVSMKAIKNDGVVSSFFTL